MPGPKLNNTRKYPDANHQPRHKAADRKMRAEVRQELSDELTLEQKIAKLPPEPYAAKQRARYQAQLAKKNAPKPDPKFVEGVKEGLKDAEEGKTTPHEQVKRNLNKRYMKGAK